VPSFAHISDLHFGRDDQVVPQMQRLVSHLLSTDTDRVLCTGDITHRGREAEFEAFIDVFAPLMAQGRLTSVPGNHDRGGDDVADSVMHGRRVQAEDLGALYVVRLDSTGPHNRQLFCGHGLVTPTDLVALRDALDEARDGQLSVVMMHHHPYPLPEEGALERFSRWAGLPFADALHSGVDVLDIASGRCDVLLHGHRHVATQRVRPHQSRPLGVYNAGATGELRRYRVFEHHAGKLCAPPRWVDLRPALAPPSRSGVAGMSLSGAW
jgi:3',5'-cyclic AMP phosphodiesterase CpdA